MTPSEIHTAITSLRKEVGYRAYVSVDIVADDLLRGGDKVVAGCLYPDGISGKSVSVRVNGHDFGEVIDLLRFKWSERRESEERQTIRLMALEIINITADMGACSDAALRAGKFSNDDVTRFGDQACEEANRIAAGGPFTITKISAVSNAA